jgi:hypothetical protein
MLKTKRNQKNSRKPRERATLENPLFSSTTRKRERESNPGKLSISLPYVDEQQSL